VIFSDHVYQDLSTGYQTLEYYTVRQVNSRCMIEFMDKQRLKTDDYTKNGL